MGCGAERPCSWTYILGASVDVVGRWRRDGVTSAVNLANLAPESAVVPVAMAGTSDIRHGVSISTTVASVDGIVVAMGVDGVVLAAVSPQTEFATDVQALDAALAALAARLAQARPAGVFALGRRVDRGCVTGGSTRT